MPIHYSPQKGQVLMCDFTQGFTEPEMVKNRPVVVFKSFSRSRLVIVIPISTVSPRKMQNYHYEIPKMELPNKAYFKNKTSWLKGDMIYTVGWRWLELIRLGRVNGKRSYFVRRFSSPLLTEVERCVVNGIGLSRLEKYIK